MRFLKITHHCPSVADEAGIYILPALIAVLVLVVELATTTSDIMDRQEMLEQRVD